MKVLVMGLISHLLLPPCLLLHLVVPPASCSPPDHHYMSMDLDHQKNLRGNLELVREDVFGKEYNENGYPKSKGRCDLRFNSRMFIAYCSQTGWIALGRTKQLVTMRTAGQDTYDRWVRETRRVVEAAEGTEAAEEVHRWEVDIRVVGDYILAAYFEIGSLIIFKSEPTGYFAYDIDLRALRNEMDF